MAHLFGRWNPYAQPQNAWEQYTSLEKDLPGRAQAGNIHFPPNGGSDYDYGNPTPVRTFAPQWKRYPFLLGDSAVVHCTAWGCDQLDFISWWHRHLPHFACQDQSGFLNNWWAYIVDFTEAKALEQAQPGCDCLFFADNLATQAPRPFSSTLTLQPNPALNEVWVNAPGHLSEILIFNVLGEKVKQITASLPGGEAAWRLDLTGLPAGIYFLQGRLTDGSVAVGRLQIVR